MLWHPDRIIHDNAAKLPNESREVLDGWHIIEIISTIQFVLHAPVMPFLPHIDMVKKRWHQISTIYDVSAEGDSDLPAFQSPAGWIKGKWTETEYWYYGIGTTSLLSQNAGLPMTESVLRSNQHKLGRCLVLVYLQSQIQNGPLSRWQLILGNTKNARTATRKLQLCRCQLLNHTHPCTPYHNYWTIVVLCML